LVVSPPPRYPILNGSGRFFLKYWGFAPIFKKKSSASSLAAAQAIAECFLHTPNPLRCTFNFQFSIFNYRIATQENKNYRLPFALEQPIG
jgi:hypothetical protein